MDARPLPPVLALEPLAPERLLAPHPEHDPEGRNVVFSGQLLAQMIMAADHALKSAHDVKSIHAIFSGAGSYDRPLELQLESTHAGRSFGSLTVTAFQAGRLLSRALLLTSAHEADLIRHAPRAPRAPDPESLPRDPQSLVFPGAETRTVSGPDELAPDGTPMLRFWLRAPARYASVALNQAILAWSQPGQLIGLALRAHPGVGSIRDAHVSLSTGVIAHTAHFHERFDAGDWLLLEQQATHAGHGRVHGSGRVYDREGRLVSTFAQDSMVRLPDRPLDPGRSM